MPLWFILLLISPFVGSFLGVVILRYDHTVFTGRSHCDACGHVLSGRDLVPVVSWLALGRRCRFCAAPLGGFYPGIELAAIVPVAWAAALQADGRLLVSAILGWLLLTLGMVDWRDQLLPNLLTYGLVGFSLIAAYVLNRQSFADHVIGAAAGFAVFALVAIVYRAVHHREGLGFGDAKLLAGLGGAVTWWGLPSVILLAAIMGLAFALGRAAWTRSLATRERIAFGPFLAFSGWIVWLYGPRIPSL